MPEGDLPLVGYYGNIRYFARVPFTFSAENEEDVSPIIVKEIKFQFGDGRPDTDTGGYGVWHNNGILPSSRDVLSNKIKCFVSIDPDAYRNYKGYSSIEDTDTY
jgi:hypothetical protein